MSFHFRQEKKQGYVELLVNKPFRMKQTQMYVCTLEEFILVDVVTLLYKLEVNWRCMEYAVVYIQMQQ